MNIVKGVADLIRRTSSGQTGESILGSHAQRFSPGPKICFSEIGDEEVLHTLWQRFNNAIDKGEKRRLFHVFLKQFLVAYKNWEPVNFGSLSESGFTASRPLENSSHSQDIVVGCSAGHPAEIILILVEEISHLTTMVSELNTAPSSDRMLQGSTSLYITSEGLPVLESLTIVTRSLHNCKVFGYYGGIPKLIALMKGAVVQLKTTGAVFADGSVCNIVIDIIGILQQILVYVVSILHTFINLDLIVLEHMNTDKFVLESSPDASISCNLSSKDEKLHWRQKAVVSVMEAGGVNWLLELLRGVRRLNMIDVKMDIMLQFLTLRILCSALSENPRGQNHFKSLGGLEVLLDGLGLPSNNFILKDFVGVDEKRNENAFVNELQLHVLSLQVLREAVFGNLNNLQFLCENGRIHKFANSLCAPAFILQDYEQHTMDLPGMHDSPSSNLDNEKENFLETQSVELLAALRGQSSCSQLWDNYTVKLCSVLCSFIFVSEHDIAFHIQIPSGRSSMPISSIYGELSIRWFIRVLQTVFPCIKACSNQNKLPSTLRVFVHALQQCILTEFRRILVSSPISLEVFRDEGMYDLLFSENVFYYGPGLEGFSEEYSTVREGSIGKPCINFDKNGVKVLGGDILQMEVISLVEFAATSCGSTHNLPELSALLDAFEQSASNPEVANIIAKSLLRILQLSTEKTIASFKTLDAVSRLLQVACMQAQEYRRSENTKSSLENNLVELVTPNSPWISNSRDIAQTWLFCMETSVELFSGFFLIGDDAKSLVLHNSTCIDCLFDLFWEESVRNHVFKHILELMKTLPYFEEDKKSKLLLCSKYLETFTQIKEREKRFVELSIELLVGIREMLLIDPPYYQALFRDGECFLHIVSLLNGNVDEESGEMLALNVLQTLTYLLASNDISKAAFKALAGKGYQTFQGLLLDFCQWHSSEKLLNSLLDMLVDGSFDTKMNPIIQNEDVILLYLSVLQKSSESLQQNGLSVFEQLLRDSISNRASCVRAGMLNFILDWFSQENNDTVILKIAQLIQVIGGHSISGMEIRKIFSLLRGEKVGTRPQYCSLLLSSILSMLNEKGPTAFFDFNGTDSGIIIKTPIQWPLSKGFSFSCWLRVEMFPSSGALGLFSFLAENGRGCFSVLSKDNLIYESMNLKRQFVQLPVNVVQKKWHYLCITHSIGRAFSGGSLLRCYVDGHLISSERCRYAKVNELLTCCTVGGKIILPLNEEDSARESIGDVYPFLGQIGPIYLFSDAISSEQVQDIYTLGPNYMYSFLDNDVAPFCDSPLPSGILHAKDGLASKIILGLNAQASHSKELFNVSPSLDLVLDKSSFEASVLAGTELCSRRLLQQIIYCVGGVSVLFPLIAQTGRYIYENRGQPDQEFVPAISKCHLIAEAIKLVASVLDENLANQQQMHFLSGFSILGFLLQSVPRHQVNLETLSALKHLLNVVVNCGLAELLINDAISNIFLNPLIWIFSGYEVQRELYMFLIQQFDNDSRLLKSLCQLPRVLDLIRKFYGENNDYKYLYGSKFFLDSTSKEIIGERPNVEEIRKIRLLLLSLGEMSLRQNVGTTDIKALIAFFETSQDLACIEDVLHMVIRAVSQKSFLASFLEQVNLIGGCRVFVNLLQREFEPIRLLSLQFLGKLLVGIPYEKKGPRFFNLPGRSRSHLEGNKNIGLGTQPIFSAISDRLFRFSLTDNLCATLFDVLLGGASPKQVLQKKNQVDRQRSKTQASHFFLPQILVLIFRFLSICEDKSTRLKIIVDLVELLDTNPSNIEAFMEHGWHAWLTASIRLDAFKDYSDSENQCGNDINERCSARNLFCVVLSYYIVSIKGGWQQLEETVSFLLMQFEQGNISCLSVLRNIYEDLSRRLVDLSAEENIFVSQPCRDNSLYFLRLLDEMLISEIKNTLPFPATGSDYSLFSLDLTSHKDYNAALQEVLEGESNERESRILHSTMENEAEMMDEKWWFLYDSLWIFISELNGKGLNRKLPKLSAGAGPSFGQRARGLVESLNIPAAEVAAVVVSGGIGSALTGKTNKNIDKAMILRGEKFPTIIIRLVILYLSRSSLEKASRCVQQVVSILPCLVSDDEQNKNRLQFFIWSLLCVRSQYATSNDDARFHCVAHLIRATVNCSKILLTTSVGNRDDSLKSSTNLKETRSINNLIQQERVLAAIEDDEKYIKGLKSDRTRQVHELCIRMEESSIEDSANKKDFEDEMLNGLNFLLVSDNRRRTEFELAYEEQQQIIAGKWIHLFRALIDERGSWCLNSFPTTATTHWKLDKTEDAWRRRPKLRKNYHFDEKLCHPSSNTPTTDYTLLDESKSSFVGHVPEQIKRLLLKGVRIINDDVNSEPREIDIEQNDEKASQLKIPSGSQETLLVKDSDDWKDIVQERDSSTNTPESDKSEVLMSVQCVLVNLKRKLAGHLAVMKNVLHFFGEFLVEGTGGSSVFKNFHASKSMDLTKDDNMQKSLKWPLCFELDGEKCFAVDNIVSIEGDDCNQKPFKNFKRHRRWNVEKIKAVHWTRYLLRYTAIEIFFSDSVAPIFLNFPSQKVAKAVGTLIVSARNEYLLSKGSIRSKSEAITFVDRRVALEMAEIARESWRRRDITNFEYLIILNTLAGRSYNDLTQYPVFPWILADYSSETLDFNKSSTFRDLSKPVGALDSKRLEVFEERYRNFCDPDIPSFYYGSHYSSMGIVLYYLLRLEPFTSLHRNLQGGKFDHADRLFQSVEGTYRNCLSNTSDVKELIPEFFYLPEFLVNLNSYHLGVKQDGELICDISLPPWAKGSPEEFIGKNREALESEYVSSNLHHWIDLIFGYKQRGKPAIEAANIFYYLTYEGAVDLDTMEDDLQRSAIEDQIANFGQTPIQIFRKKHPRRGPPIPIAHPLYFAPGSINLTSIVSTANYPASATIYIGVLDSHLVLVSQGLILSIKMWLTTPLQSGGNFTFSGSQDPFFGVGSDILSPRKIGSPLAENMELGEQCFAIMQTSNEKFLVSCGNWENSFQVISLTDGRMVQNIRQHKDVVSCVAVTSDGSILATGSYDTTVMVWEVLCAKIPEKRVRSTQTELTFKDYVIVETPLHILCGHDDIVTCLFASIELDIVISGSKDGTCIFHTVREGRYVRSLHHPSGCALSKLVASQHGRVVFYADGDLSLNLFSINGKHLASSESNGRLNCLEMSQCGEFLVCAGDHGQIVVRSMNSLEVVRKYNGIGKVIMSLAVTTEECFIAGTKDGNLLVYSIENSQQRKANLSQNTKSKATIAG